LMGVAWGISATAALAITLGWAVWRRRSKTADEHDRS